MKKQALKYSLLTLALLPALGFAAGFQINETSPRLQGQAMAGSGSDTDDVTAIFNNPALLSTIKGRQAYAGASYIAPHISMKNASAINDTNTSQFPGAPQPVSGNTSQSNIGPDATVPAFYISTPLKNGFYAGFALTAPWGLTTNYDTDSVVRYMAQNSSLMAIDLTPMLSYKINDKLSVGVGVQEQFASATFSNFAGSNVISPSPTPTNIEGNGWGTGYLLGFLFTPNDKTSVGLSYRSQINYSLKGNYSQNVVAMNGPHHIPNLPYNSNGSVSANLNTPAVLNLSASEKISNRWILSATEQITFWNSLSNISIDMPGAYVENIALPLNWKNSSLTALGAEYLLNEHWHLRSGLAYDTTPTQAAYRDARIPDTDRTLVTVGASYFYSDRFTFDTAYEHIFMKNQSINLTQIQGTPVAGHPYTANTVQADYAGSANIFAVGINYKF